MVSFDQVLPTLVKTCEAWGPFVNVKRATVVRDLEGRVRMALALTSMTTPFDADALTNLLRGEIQQWLGDDIVVADGRSPRNKLLSLLVNEPQSVGAQEWEPSYETAPGAGPTTVAAGRWWLVERRLSKVDWAQPSGLRPPWPLGTGSPSLITFYSFKGGVGRSTLAAAVAWHLARKGRRVVVVDLDLEAPGIASLLGAGNDGRGVLDFLVDNVGTGAVEVESLLRAAAALNNEAHLVDVVGAGELNAQYFEKLSRLDFIGAGLTGTGVSPVASGLKLLLTKLRYRSSPPDFILLDARAGLHDLAGLSLHGLAHIDVLVARESEQSHRGLDLVVRALGRARLPAELACVVVHSLAPADRKSKEYENAVSEFRRRSFDAFSTHVYAKMEEDDPSVDDDAGAHYSWPIGFTDRLIQFTELASVEDVLFGPDYVNVVERIQALATVTKVEEPTGVPA